MTIPDEAVQAAARKDAEMSGRTFDALSSSEKKRYLVRSQEQLTAAAPFLQGVKVDAQGIYDYVQGYEWRGDNGDYTPNDADREMLEDAIVGYLSAIEPAPSPRVQALEEAAKIAFDVSENGHYYGEASVDSTSSIYQQGAFEVYEALRALSSQPVDQEAKDFEEIGRAFMSCFEVITTEGTEWDGYTPAECPSELVMDIFAAQQELKSSQPVADGLPQDVVNLVIAAREAWDTWQLPEEEFKRLDTALEAFASRVPYENEPEALPASPGASE